jgi:hypothetical protein
MGRPHPIRCGRESRLARRLSHSEVVLNHPSRLLCISGYSYTLPVTNFLHLFKLLTICFFNSELQVDVYNMSKDPQLHSMHSTCKFITCHLPSRFSSNILHLPRGIGLWFRFYFPSFKCFCLFFKLSCKIQDFDTFSLPWLVNIQVNRLIVQMSRVEDSSLGMLRACRGSERRLSIEWPGDWITP